jgi:hypothetical protein
VSYKLKAPLLAKNARNGAPSLLEGYVANGDVGHPPAVLLRGKQKKALTLLPAKPRHPERYKCEGYRDLGAAVAEPELGQCPESDQNK